MSQARQDVAPVSFWYVPPPQLAHSERPAVAATVPGRHGAHTSRLTAPGAALEVPAGHSSHAALELEPLFGLNVPAGQACQTRREAAPASSQTPPFGQASQAALPTSGEKEPAAQGKHSSWPLSGWYWPGAQRKQSEMFAARLLGMWVPAGHFCGRTDPSGQKCPNQQGPLQSEVKWSDAFP